MDIATPILHYYLFPVSILKQHLLRAAILYDRRELPAAEAGMEQALAIDPEYDEVVYYQLALTEMRQKKYDEAG